MAKTYFWACDVKSSVWIGSQPMTSPDRAIVSVPPDFGVDPAGEDAEVAGLLDAADPDALPDGTVVAPLGAELEEVAPHAASISEANNVRAVTTAIL